MLVFNYVRHAHHIGLHHVTESWFTHTIDRFYFVGQVSLLHSSAAFNKSFALCTHVSLLGTIWINVAILFRCLHGWPLPDWGTPGSRLGYAWIPLMQIWSMPADPLISVAIQAQLLLIRQRKLRLHACSGVKQRCVIIILWDEAIGWVLAMRWPWV